MSTALFRTLIVSAAIALGCQWADAIPARKGVVEVPQPDGTFVKARIYGDEFHHFATTPDGTPLIEDEAGFLRTGDVDPALFMATMSDMASRSPRRMRAAARTKAPGIDQGYGLVPATSFPPKGSPKALIILVEYTDVKFTVSDPYDYFNRMINEPGFSDLGGTGSAIDFFTENSLGQFTPQFDVYGPVTLPNTRAYYGENGSNGDDKRAHLMAIDACRILDGKVDFSQYDNDGDGAVDNVFVFFAGEAESSTFIKDMVWPHAYFVSYLDSTPYIFDGVRIDRYGCTNEWNGPGEDGTPARPDGVGTFIHEFSHVMGLPDLYSTKYTEAFTPGTWSALDYGPYNNGGCTPPNYSVFERYALGWLQPRELVSAANVRLEPITSNQAAMVPTLKETEFFLFENRQQDGWDKFIPGHGMLVWHIDYDADKWKYNIVNNTTAHQNVDIEEADGMATEETRADDAFPGGLERTSFTDTTIPSMLPWNGRSINMPVTDIAESPDGVITFKIAGGRPDIAVPVASEADAVSPGSFTAHWEAVAVEGCTYTLSVYTRTGPGVRGIVYLPDYNHRAVGSATEFTVTGLTPDTQYYYTVCTVVKGEESEPSQEMAVRTDPPTFDFLAPTAHEATAIYNEGFTASWEPMADATEYFLTVLTALPDGALKATFDFTGGISAMPAGWTTTATSTYAISGNCGAAVPSLRITKSGQTLTTATMPDEISAISLWARGVSSAPDDYITIEGCDADGKWAELSRHTVSTKAGGQTIGTDVHPGIFAIRITAYLSKGSMAIDDVVVSHGTAYSDFPVEGYDKRSTGTATEHKVSGLKALTSYRYVVHASNGTLTSLPSATIEAVTTASSGICAPATVEASVATDGLQVHISGCSASAISAYDTAGRCVASAAVKGGAASMALPAPDIYILMADGRLIKKLTLK
ncbi:MAG: M6 family metalloprotease domain-containing protein [Muribaculaceae bacterium]|nr:M6 family metalloprotease domain-containing protein [Muribaculaceae bacterium]